MTTPNDVNSVFQTMLARFDPQAADGFDKVIQYDIDGANWHVVIKDGTCEVVEAEHDDPDVTLAMSEETFIAVMTGELDGTAAFMSGKLQASGDMMLTMKLAALFPEK